uniref:Uncharacterized protein n=1 Tax=Promethearchaeum syntrophicum TaxID=2594042 RepID=A0A5B9DEL5_9ARCH|nr:hypothetical protein DSAG12_03045 [Candidatus Prometheoarchaeum syntrophicum]
MKLNNVTELIELGENETILGVFQDKHSNFLANKK